MPEEPALVVTAESPAPAEPQPVELPADAADPGRDRDTGHQSAVACPYLLAASGGWRATSPSPEHRCTAFAPPAPLALEKQRRLCLSATHVTCATYLAALAARRERGTPSDGPSPTRWALARTTPVVDVGVGVGATVAGVLADRRGWQAVPALVLVLVVVAVGLSGFGRTPPLTGAVATASPTPGESAAPTRTPSPTGTPTPSGSAAPSATPVASVLASTGVPTLAPTVAPTTAPVATAQTTYTVKRNDTLYGIAIAFGTTVAKIKQLNDLTSDLLSIGQVLLIP